MTGPKKDVEKKQSAEPLSEQDLERIAGGGDMPPPDMPPPPLPPEPPPPPPGGTDPSITRL